MSNYVTAGYTKVLHTNSSYGENIASPSTFTNKDNTLKQKIDFLSAKESSVYSKLIPGCETIEEFISAIKKLFNDNDIYTFQFFENVNIKSFLAKQFGTTTKKRQEVIIEIEQPKNAIDFSAMFDNTETVNIGKGKTQTKIYLGVDTKKVKEGLNKLFKTHLKVDSEDKTRVNQLLKNDADQLEYLTHRMLNEDPNIIVTNISGSLKDGRFAKKMVVPGSIFSYTADDLKAAKNDPALKQELIEARDQIKDFIKNGSRYSQASREMQMAIDAVWKRNIESNFMDLSLFEKGGGLDALAGAFGEFAAALLPEYINQKVKGSTFAKSLIADSLQSGEQAKADVTMLNNIGIQVKNYNVYSADAGYSKLDTKTHPTKFVQFFPDFDETNFLDFLANYFFNKSFQNSRQQDFNNLQENLSQHFAEISNLAISDTIDDLVTFYFIEGKYFVPGSHILKAYYDQNNKVSVPVSITGPEPIGDDSNFGSYQAEGTHKSLLAKYWRRTSDGNWNPKNANRSLYNNLVSSRISFRSGFNYRELPNLKMYSLF